MPVELAVEGDSVILHVDPPQDATYPILVDPLWQTYEWAAKNTTAGICSSSTGTEPGGSCEKREEWGYDVLVYPWGGLQHLRVGTGWGPAQPGLFATAEGAQRAGDHGALVYTVPRYFKESPPPNSYIKSLHLSNVTWQALGASASPYLFMGIWNSVSQSWIQYFSHTGQAGHGINDPAWPYEFSNSQPNKNGKVAQVGIWATEASTSSNARVYVGSASVELGDTDVPHPPIAGTQTKWAHTSAPPLSFTAVDSGLGAYAMNVTMAGRTRAGLPPQTWKALQGCVGIGNAACPQTWSSTETGSPALNYDPSVLPNGVNYLALVAEDPVGNKSASSWAEVRIDHTPPEVTSLSGSLTEQGTVGTNLSEYTLNYGASDGDDAAASAQSPIGSQGTGAGQLERPQGVAVDANGNVWVTDRVNQRVVAYDKNGSYLRQISAQGSGDGQIKEPRGIAIGPNGNIWVAEAGNKRIQQFTPAGTFVSKVTNAAFVEPWGVAFGPGGEMWVTDSAAKKVFLFNSSGSLSKTISSSGQLSLAPNGIDIDQFGNAWIASQGSHQVIELSPTGALLQSFGSEGTGPGQFRHPIDIAVADSGNILVSDDLNDRIQVFKPDGSFLRQFGASGTGNSQFEEPRAVDVGSGNTAVIADAGNHRVARWAHADQDPQSGVAKVEIKVDGVTAHSKAPGCPTKNCTVAGSWTLDADDYSGGAHKVEVVATDAVGIEKTKTLDIETHGDGTNPTLALSGTMTQQASLGTTRPSYRLSAVATDPGPAAERKSGVAAMTIKVDGTVVDSTSPGCLAGGCSITREWTLNSDNYSVGPHTVEVKATDAVGRSSVKTLEINIARDTTAPQFASLGPLYTRPSGWVEQKSYEYSASVTDANGYGVTSVQLKIDGQVVKDLSQACPAGGCMRFFALGQWLDLSNYEGGAHPAELIATDGAGNVHRRTWNINVDPEGHITVGEAEATLEAADTTRDSIAMAAPEEVLDPQQIEGGNNPGLQLMGEGDITSTGVPNTTTMTTNPEDGFTLQSPEAEATITPVVSDGSSSLAIADGVAGVAANTATEVDSVIRPHYNGALTFQHIRSADSSREFSWHVDLADGQILRLANSTQAEVLYESGHLAYLISSQGAHDAVGTNVPTSLSVSGDILTLTVDINSASFVYPIIAGQGWEGGYRPPVLIQGPEDELEIVEREKAEAEAETPLPIPSEGFSEVEAEEWLASSGVGEEIIPAPVPSPSGGGASASSSMGEKVVKPYRRCAELGCDKWWVEIRNPSYHYKLNANLKLTSWWQPGTEVVAESYRAWWAAPVVNVEVCGTGFVGPNQVWQGEGKHLTVWARFLITATMWIPKVNETFDKENRLALLVWVWPTGFQQRVFRHWEVTEDWNTSYNFKCAPINEL